VQDAGRPRAAQSSAETPVTIEGIGLGDEDVLAEKEAVLAGDGFATAAVSSPAIARVYFQDVLTGHPDSSMLVQSCISTPGNTDVSTGQPVSYYN